MKRKLLSWRRNAFLAAAGLAALVGLAGVGPALAASAPFGVPVRLSFKFILDSGGNRSLSGNLNTDEEVIAQVERGNAVFSRWISELRFHNVEIVEVSGVSQWFLAGTDDLGALYAAATADPGTYHFRSDAINIYITGAGGSAVSYYPPNNKMVMCCQGSHDTSVAHELGHSLYLRHTHAGQSDACTNCAPACRAGAANADECTDTLPDTSCWDRDDISTNAYGLVYAALSTAQKYQVDMVWSNLMSYHNVDYRCMLSPCQMDIQSTQVSDDQAWMVSKRPVYVDAGYAGTHSGTFAQPYQTIQQAVNAGVLNNKVLVLDTGTHGNPTSVITTSTDVVTRKGSSTVRDAPPKYTLPYAMQETKNAAVRDAIVRVQRADRLKDIEGVITNLLEAERYATGRERDAIRLELAQRYRDSGRLAEAAAWFQKTADDADQPALKQRAQEKANIMKDEMEQQKKQKEKRENDDSKK